MVLTHNDFPMGGKASPETEAKVKAKREAREKAKREKGISRGKN